MDPVWSALTTCQISSDRCCRVILYGKSKISILRSPFLHVLQGVNQRQCSNCALNPRRPYSAGVLYSTSFSGSSSCPMSYFKTPQPLHSATLIIARYGPSSYSSWVDCVVEPRTFHLLRHFGLHSSEFPAHIWLRLPLTPPDQSSCHLVRGKVRRATRVYIYNIPERTRVAGLSNVAILNL
jgi:hypothetical protein